MIVLRKVVEPDVIERKVLFAVELIDPLTYAFVYRDVEVKAEGFNQRPIVSRSGRFVWLTEGDKWPGAITVTPHGLLYAPQRLAAPARPVDFDRPQVEERTVRITLRPTAAYPVDAGITVVRGRLCETDKRDSAAMPNVLVQLAFLDKGSGAGEGDDKWVPEPPQPEPGGDDDDAPSPREVQTDATGQFIAVIASPFPEDAHPDSEKRKIKVRLQFTRGRENPVTRVTTPDFDFIEGEKTSRVLEGRVLARDLKVAWNKLNPI